MKTIVAVASCPAGIAHTYLAAESLEKVGKKHGYVVKVETDGAGGVMNRLTKEDITEAVAVIVAADTTVPMERFRGKPVLSISTGDAIRSAEKCFQLIEEGKVEIY
ncbi:MAG TPA: PTS sugar transporter subunit IIC [Anaerolineaceae bacterium]|nr:PTS sugar transporter subunit IIC [Anaerolineaceae bacterium]